jgi:Tfp pilus assembly protein PilO
VDFESVIKLIVAITAAVAIPVAAYAAIVAIRAIRIKPPRSEPDGGTGEVESLRARVAELEAMRDRMLELEERLDFAERMLVQQRDAARLPGGTEDR